ncbi:hypothetical protein Micbo1qcDRAFT_195907 [Microdochium bolleyi]|uniref:HD/PDEase domain-containing protein n=1 Tax=Microdochium bolleyi TaxID=196109 RepID=A0A136J1M1_9PEZI|nr:hypothetical protein Micbo1qcDRAFT_195907 [Microdochium bolleyi]
MGRLGHELRSRLLITPRPASTEQAQQRWDPSRPAAKHEPVIGHVLETRSKEDMQRLALSRDWPAPDPCQPIGRRSSHAAAPGLQPMARSTRTSVAAVVGLAHSDHAGGAPVVFSVDGWELAETDIGNVTGVDACQLDQIVSAMAKRPKQFIYVTTALSDFVVASVCSAGILESGHDFANEELELQLKTSEEDRNKGFVSVDATSHRVHRLQNLQCNIDDIAAESRAVLRYGHWLDDQGCGASRRSKKRLVEALKKERCIRSRCVEVSVSQGPSSDDQHPSNTNGCSGGSPASSPDALVRAVTDYVKSYMAKYDGSHDYHHIERVVGLARHIHARSGPDTPAGSRSDIHVVTLSALLHDVGDKKYLKPGEDHTTMIAKLLVSLGAGGQLADRVQAICLGVSYSSEIKDPEKVSRLVEEFPELAIVQDADRLDAIGAIGIGRTFTFGGAKGSAGGGRSMYGTIEHFHEKLLRLEGMMKTEVGRELARERTVRMEQFLEWWSDEKAFAGASGLDSY